MDVVQDLAGRDTLLHQQAQGGAGRPQPPGDAQGKGAVLPGPKAHVPEGGVDAVVYAVAEGDLQLAGHTDVPADGQQVVRHRLGIGDGVEGLAGLDAGQGAAHHVAGVVAAAALAVDAAGDGRLHEGGHLGGGEVVELDRLTGGELEPPHLMLFHRAGQELQPVRGEPPRRQAQAEHVSAVLPLGVAAQAAGQALIGLPVQLAPVEGGDGILEAVDLLAEDIGPLLCHDVFCLSDLDQSSPKLMPSRRASVMMSELGSMVLSLPATSFRGTEVIT